MKFKLKKVNKNITREDIIADFKRVAKITGSQYVTSRDCKKHGNYAINTVIRLFGSWNNAVLLAGFKATQQRGIPVYELFYNLKQVWLKLGRQPLRKEMRAPLSKYSWRTYRNRFGSFRKALEEFVKFANRRRMNKVPTPFIDKTKQLKNRTSRVVGFRLRYIVLKRDGYKCVLCGSSPAYGHAVNLQVDHIKPYSKGGETVLSNLQTLCEACNIGKGNR